MSENEKGKPAKKKVRVHRSNIDPDNKQLPISICANKPSERIRFQPGQIVALTESQLNILKDSVDETAFQIPPHSGIYKSRDPLMTAQASYPNMVPEINWRNGIITVRQCSPNYIVEYV